MVASVELPEVRLLLRRFALHRDRWIDALCRHVGVSRSDYDALEALDEHGSLTPGELGTLLSLTSGSVTALIDRLERLGWASRSRHPDDRRKLIVTLTQKAWQIGQDELKPYLQAVDAAAGQLGTDDRAVVVGFLKNLIDEIAHAPLPEESGEAQSHVPPDGVTHAATHAATQVPTTLTADAP
jgi:DNA-binding MarR family transcriptional regulator